MSGLIHLSPDDFKPDADARPDAASTPFLVCGSYGGIRLFEFFGDERSLQQTQDLVPVAYTNARPSPNWDLVMISDSLVGISSTGSSAAVLRCVLQSPRAGSAAGELASRHKRRFGIQFEKVGELEVAKRRELTIRSRFCSFPLEGQGGATVIAGPGMEGNVMLYRPDPCELICTMRHKTRRSSYSSVCRVPPRLIPGGATCVAASHHNVDIFDVEKGTLSQSLTGPQRNSIWNVKGTDVDNIFGVEVEHPLLLAGSSDHFISAWDPRSSTPFVFKMTPTVRQETRGMTSIPEKSIIHAFSYGGRVTTFDIRKPESQIHSFVPHPMGQYCYLMERLRPHRGAATRLASISWGGNSPVSVWDGEKQKVLATCQKKAKDNWGICIFSPDRTAEYLFSSVSRATEDAREELERIGFLSEKFEEFGILLGRVILGRVLRYSKSLVCS